MESLRTHLTKIKKVIQPYETRGFEGQEYLKKINPSLCLLSWLLTNNQKLVFFTPK